MTTQQTLALIAGYESRNITFLDPAGSWPIVWQRANGVHVWDAEERQYLDLTAAFGVAATGHANPRVVRAGQRQMECLLHAMGDVHPHELKARLVRQLSRLTFERWAGRNQRGRTPRHRDHPSRTGLRTPISGKTILCNSGFEAVEAALKTARLATGKPGILAFEGAYHGLGYGTLNATHRKHFRGPFLNQLKRFGQFLPFPVGPNVNASSRSRTEWTARRFTAAATVLFTKHKIGAILVEPVQARGGIRVPPRWFLPTLRRLCDRHGALLILDEIYTGLGRTGEWFACEYSRTVPDVICLGKALAGGFPLSACVGRAEVMDAAWPKSTGEAIHTSTFLGHPVGCAMALTQIAEIARLGLVTRSARLGQLLLRELGAVADDVASRRQSLSGGRAQTRVHGLKVAVRGLGLMAGLELRRPDGSPATEETIQIVQGMLRRGFICLPEGEGSNVISFTPPLTITERQISRTVAALQKELAAPERR